MYAKSDNQKRRSFFLSGGDMLVTHVYLMPSGFDGWVRQFYQATDIDMGEWPGCD